MKLSTKILISVAAFLASSLRTYAHPVELKGIKKAVQVNQEKVNNNIRDEFIELPKEEIQIDVEPYGPIFDIVCQSDISEWCLLYPEQCSYVKTLCVRNEDNGYCAFDIYKKYEEATENNKKHIESYMDLCDECLIDMAKEFQNNSRDEEAINEINTLAEICKVKLYVKSINKKENKSGGSSLISTLASLIPSKEMKSKRNYGKIHSFKNPDVGGGFVKSNGKIKYGNVGINEKVNFSIHNKNLRSSARSINNKGKVKRQDEGEGEEEVMMMNIKEKIAMALDNIKELALEKVNSVINNLEVNVSVMLEEDLFISDPENTREKNVITNEIIDNIKDILNNVDDISEAEEADTEADTEAEEVEAVAVATTDIEEETEAETEAEEVEVVAVATTDVEQATETVENVSDDMLPPLPIIDIFNLAGNDNDIPMNKKEYDENGIFLIEENNPEYDVYIADDSAAATTKVSENVEVPTEATTDVEEEEEETSVPEETQVPVPDEGEEGDDEEEPTQEIDETSDDDDNNDSDESDQEPPHDLKPPVVGPEKPVIRPGKPSWPVKPGDRPPVRPDHPKNPLKFKWPYKSDGKITKHGKYTVINAINRIFENVGGGEDQANDNILVKRGTMMKKSEYVVSNELLNESEEQPIEEVGEEEVVNDIEQEAKSHIEGVAIESHEIPSEENNIKLNNLDNHRDTDEEEVFEIGAKKVAWINSYHPNKPSLNFREDKRRETH